MTENAIQGSEEAHKNLEEEVSKRSGGALRVAKKEEMADMNAHESPYVNKFLCSVLRNNAVHLGFSLENNANDSKFKTAIITDIQCIQNLHQLLSQLLQSFQQQQMKMMQELQGKVNPNFVEQIKAAQEAQTGKKTN